jgi:transposase-like protein
MAAKKKLSEDDWARMIERVIAGDAVRAVARDFGVSDTAIRKRVGLQSNLIKDVAKQIVDTKAALEGLQPSLQLVALSFADKMISIQNDLSDVAVAGARSAKILTEAAHNNLIMAKDIGEGEVKAVMIAANIANAAGKMGMDLMTLATKPGAMKQPGENEGPGSKLVNLTPEDIRKINKELQSAC